MNGEANGMGVVAGRLLAGLSGGLGRRMTRDCGGRAEGGQAAAQGFTFWTTPAVSKALKGFFLCLAPFATDRASGWRLWVSRG